MRGSCGGDHSVAAAACWLGVVDTAVCSCIDVAVAVIVLVGMLSMLLAVISNIYFSMVHYMIGMSMVTASNGMPSWLNAV